MSAKLSDHPEGFRKDFLLNSSLVISTRKWHWRTGARWSCGTQNYLLTVASFRTWRDSQGSVAQGPAPTSKQFW